MSCDECENAPIGARSQDFEDGVSVGLRHATLAIESAYGHQDKDIPDPVITVMATFTDILDELEYRRLERFRRDTGARLPSKEWVDSIKVRDREA